jgi:ferredoxin--NADP+ reductase
MLGRRGPAQAAFTNAEVKELGELEGADLIVRRSDLELDTLSESELAKGDDRAAQKKVEILRALAARAPQGRARQLKLRFLVSPVELTADSDGRVAGMRLVRNVLYRAEDGALRPKPSDEHENLPVKLVFRSVGYRGVALPQLPFEERRGVIPSDQGRVVDPENGRPVPGLYVTGWIKRGPSGIIGTNKPDAGETVASMAGDAAEGLVPEPAVVDADAIERLVRERQPDVVGFDDWQRLDAFEMERGAASGRPRVKLTSLAEALAQLRGS